MDPFIAISRREVVELPQPWDAERVVMDYIDEVGGSGPAINADDLKELEQGTDVRYELEHGLMGRIQAEMRLVVLSPQRLDISIDGAWWLTWWLRILALPFRGRLRRWLDGRVEELLAELSAEPAEETDVDVEPFAGTADESDSGRRWTLEILTPGGRSVYRRKNPGPSP